MHILAQDRAVPEQMKVALVTGAGTGVGRAVAHALAADGFSIVLSGRRRELLEHVAGELPGE